MSPQNILAVNRAFYRDNLAGYDSYVASFGNGSGHKAFASLLPKGARILDAGCGPGRDAVRFSRLGCRVTAIDASSEMVKMCRSRGIDARVGTLQGLRFKGSFDAVWASASLLHIPRSQIRRTLRGLFLALRSGGYIYITLWEGKGEGICPDGRFVSLHRYSSFKRFLEQRDRGKVVYSWRIPSRAAVVGPAWMGFLARKH